MIIRKFVIQIVAKFTDKGFRDADKQMAKLKVRAAELTKGYDALTRAQIAAAQAAKKAGDAADNEADVLLRLQLRTIKLDEKIEDLNEAIAKQRKKLDQLSKRSLKNVGAAFGRASERMAKFRTVMAPVGEAARTAGRAIASFAAAGVAVGAGVIKVGTDFEVLRARLKTVEGSAEGAQRAFGQIQEFTKTTPFQLEEVTTAFVRLKSLGLDASQQSLSAFGNLAAAQGKSIIDFIEAVADASTGEFERLKEFGIKASSQGEQVAFTFKGTTTTVGKNADEIQAFLRGLGETEFAGAMDEQMSTAAGAISNLKDTFSTFLDQVAQMGVLDEFKGLLGDLSGLAGGEGFAGIVAGGLVEALKSLREWLAEVSEQDIREFLMGVADMARTLLDAFGKLIDIMKAIVDASSDTGTGLKNLALIVTALSVAMTGPGGLVVAAGLVGVALGSMAETAARSQRVMSTVNNAILSDLQRQVAELRKINDDTDALFAKIKAGDEQFKKDMSEIRKRSRQKVESVTGPLGAGLTKDIAEEDVSGVAEQIQAGGTQRELGLRAALTEEGRQIVDAVEAAGQQQIDKAEQRARREAKRRGATEAAVARAGANARSAAVQKVVATRKQALAEADKAFQETGSVDVAVGAATKKLRGKKRGGSKGGSVFFDFEKKAEQAARSQAETFAEQELQRLISEGVASKDAIAQAQAAGKKRAEDLEKQFLEAGRVFDASANSVLDLLGLRGPGSVLEGRPPPQTLIISPTFKVTFIENFNQTNEGITGATALAEVTGEGGREAVEQGLTPNLDFVRTLVENMFSLKMQEIANALGGGRVAPGPQG